MTVHAPETFREFAAVRGFDLDHELVVDCFAGGGGASEGMEDAIRRLKVLGILPLSRRANVDIAINHDDKAIAMHLANHPNTMHVTADIWTVDPLSVTGGLQVGAVWASPDCRHHSKAKGGRPVSESVRDLAWVVAHWCEQVHPREVYLENVEEFRDWGPLVSDGAGGMRPNKLQKGATFKRWVRKFKAMGYRVEWQERRANLWGVPTIRKRLYIMMRNDGEPIVWPPETHADPKSEEVARGEKQAWPIAADIIDWDRPCPSIFLTKADARELRRSAGISIIRPLADNTHARIAKGIKRYVLDRASPFIVTCNHAGEFRGQSIDASFNTVAAARDAHGVVIPSLISVNHGDSGGRREYGVDESFGTVETAPSKGLIEAHIAPSIVGVGGRMGQSGPRSVEAPWHTATTKPDSAIVAPYLVPRYGERDGQEPRTLPIDGSTPTIVPTGNGAGIAAAELAPFITHGQHGGRSRGADEPHHTVEASTKDTNQVAAVYLAQHNENRIGVPADGSMPAVTTRGTQTQQVAAFLAQNNTDMVGHDLRESTSTIVGKGSTQSFVAASVIEMHGKSGARPVDAPASSPTTKSTPGFAAAHMISLKGSDRRAYGADRPVEAITADGQHAGVVTLPLMTAYYGSDEVGGAEDAPVRSVTSKARFGHIEATAAAPPLTDSQLARARQVADFLRAYGCWDDREFVTVGQWVVIDIGMRMLTPRELARAQGFSDSYVLAAPYNGKTLTETDQRHKIGNSVCPAMAASLFMANYRPKPRAANSPDQGWLLQKAA